jgi:hypothetical protein
MSEAEIHKAHDETNDNRALPSTYYLDELRRREQAQAEAAAYELATESQKLAKQTYRLTVVSAVVAVAAIAVAVIAIFVSIRLAHSGGAHSGGSTAALGPLGGPTPSVSTAERSQPSAPRHRGTGSAQAWMPFTDTRLLFVKAADSARAIPSVT